MLRRMLVVISLLLLVCAAPVAAQQGDIDDYRPTNLVVQGDQDGIHVSGEGCDSGPERDDPSTGTVHYEVRRGSSPNGQLVAQGTADATGPRGAFSFEITPLSSGRYTVRVTCGGNTASASAVVGSGSTNPGQGNGPPGDPGQGNPGQGQGQVAGDVVIGPSDGVRGSSNPGMVGVSFSEPASDASSSLPARLGAAMVATGGIALWSARRRRRSSI